MSKRFINPDPSEQRGEIISHTPLSEQPCSYTFHGEIKTVSEEDFTPAYPSPFTLNCMAVQVKAKSGCVTGILTFLKGTNDLAFIYNIQQYIHTYGRFPTYG